MALPELIANTSTPGTVTALTTLKAEASSGATEIEVNAAAPTALQAAGQFRIIIGEEIMLVTGGANTTKWTVARGANVKGESVTPTAVSHAAGASVYHLLTVGALAALYGVRTEALVIGLNSGTGNGFQSSWDTLVSVPAGAFGAAKQEPQRTVFHGPVSSNAEGMIVEILVGGPESLGVISADVHVQNIEGTQIVGGVSGTITPKGLASPATELLKLTSIAAQTGTDLHLVSGKVLSKAGGITYWVKLVIEMSAR